MSRQTTNFTKKLVLNSPDRKPSVFERLGTKSGVVSAKNVCRSWAQNGTCPLNKQCKLAQSHVLISPSKRSKSEAMKKSVVVHKKCKEEHKKSLRSHHSSELEWEGWELGDLEDADEKVLEKRKQELQRELQLQLKKEKELTRKKEKRTEKKRAASSSSSLTTTSESSSSTTSSSSSSSEPRKRTSRKRKHSSSSSESERSSHRQKKTPKTVKAKATAVRKPPEKKDVRVTSDVKSKSVVVAKKNAVQKKSYSPNWEKSRGKSPIKQAVSKKSSPHHSPVASKNKSASPRYDKTSVKSKNRNYSPKLKGKDSSPKRSVKKGKESSSQSKDKPRQSPAKAQNSPSRTRKVSPTRSRRHEETSEKRRCHYDDQKHSPRRDRSREKDRKRDVRRGRSNDNDSNGGLKKGGKILPLKPPTYNKDNAPKKDSSHHKSCDKNATDSKSKEENLDKDRNRGDREKNRGEKEKSKSERDKSRHKRSADEHEKRSGRDSDRGTVRSRDDRGRDREAERLRFAKEREAERQKERDEALERCRERQRERERLEKERKEKEEKKHQRETTESKAKTKEYERELPSLLDLKAENPNRNSGDGNNIKSADKHLPRDGRSRNLDKGLGDKPVNQERDGRDRGSPERDHDRRDSRRSNENDKRQSDKDYEGRKNRDGEGRNVSEARRNVGDGRRGGDEGSDSRRQWDDVRRPVDSVHDRRRTMDSSNSNSDRRTHTLGRRSGDDPPYRRSDRPDPDVRDFSIDDRRSRKLLHNCPDWDGKDQNLDYRDSEGRDDWNHADRHRDWNSRYDHKWMDREESRDSSWNHYVRRSGHEEWNGDWSQEQQRQKFSEERRLNGKGEGFADQTVKKHNENEPPSSVEPKKEKETPGQEDANSSNQLEKSARGDGDALSDISDDPDDILNQDDYPVEESLPNNGSSTKNSNQQIYIRSNEFLFDQRRPLLECLGERSLDFEEISDEELEEEARASKGIVDVLGADWAALLQETRPKAKRSEASGSAHCRWTMKSLIFSLGISVKHAGQQFTDRLIDDHGNGDEKSASENKADSNEFEKDDGREEIEGNGETATANENDGNFDFNESADTTYEKSESDSKEESKVGKMFHSVPALHSAMKESQYMKSMLFLSHNRFKRALSARTDLALRRELCNLPSKEPLHFTPSLDSRLYEASVQQFRRGSTTTAAV